MDKNKQIQSNEGRKSFSDYYNKYGIFVILILAIVISTILKPSFITSTNLINILRQNAVIAIVSFGAMLVLLSGEVDLSPGSVLAFSGCVAALVVKSTDSVVLAIIASIVIGGILGAFNGTVITKARIPSFIMTLAMQQAVRGLIFIMTNAAPIMSLPDKFTWLGQGYIGPIPVPVIVLVIIFILSWILLNKRPFGRYVYATGGNADAAKASGINVDMVKIQTFMFQGLMAGLGGVMLMSRLNSGQPTSGEAYEFDAITAAIIGGTSMKGGIGSIYGTLAGALFVGVLINIMTITNVSAYLQQVVRGVIIALAVILDTAVRTKKS